MKRFKLLFIAQFIIISCALMAMTSPSMAEGPDPVLDSELTAAETAYENKVIILNPEAQDLYGLLVASIATLDPRAGECKQPELAYAPEIYSLFQTAVITSPASACDSSLDCETVAYYSCWLLGSEIDYQSFSLVDGCVFKCKLPGSQETKVECVILKPKGSRR